MSKQQINTDRNWYAIHTYAGYENAVARNLKQRIESLIEKDYIKRAANDAASYEYIA